jgi:hypothetical protein
MDPARTGSRCEPGRAGLTPEQVRGFFGGVQALYASLIERKEER